MIADFLVCDPAILQNTAEKDSLACLADMMKNKGWRVQERQVQNMNLPMSFENTRAVFLFGLSSADWLSRNFEFTVHFLTPSDLVSVLHDGMGGIAGEVYQKEETLYFLFLMKPSDVKKIWKFKIQPLLSASHTSVSIAADIYIPITGEKDAEEKEALLRSFSSFIISFDRMDSVLSVHLGAHGINLSDARKKISEAAAFLDSKNIKNRLQWIIDGRLDLFQLLQEHPKTLAAAESCTGGLIGKMITDIPGSSQFFKGTAVTYWNEAKNHILGVLNDDLEQFTAVSAPVAKEMAEGARKLYNTDLAVSTTGYAGPGLGERGEAPGLVYIGFSSEQGTEVIKEHWHGSRSYVRYCAALRAIQYFYDYLSLQYKTQRESKGD